MVSIKSSSESPEMQKAVEFAVRTVEDATKKNSEIRNNLIWGEHGQQNSPWALPDDDDVGILALSTGGCCIGICNRDGALIIAIVAFVASFFVGLYYAARSTGKAQEYSSKIDLASMNIGEISKNNRESHNVRTTVTQYPPFQEQPVPPPSPMFQNLNVLATQFIAPEQFQPSAPPAYAPPPYSAVPPQHYAMQEVSEDEEDIKKDPLIVLYEQTQIVHRGLRNERAVTALAQWTMTAGAGLLTVACLVALIAEADILALGLVVSGAGAAGTGAVVYWINRRNRNWEAEKDACIEISRIVSELFDNGEWEYAY